MNKIETIELYKEIQSLGDDDLNYALKKKSFNHFNNDVELYVHCTESLITDLESMEEYEMCAKLKKKLDYFRNFLDS